MKTSLDPATLRGYMLLRESCGLFQVKDCGLLSMAGEDRKAWLQGQCTNDLRDLRPGGSMHACVCTPTGQLLAPCTVFSFPERFLIVCPRACVPALLERAESMIILEDVQVSEVTADYEWYSIQGPTATTELGETLALPTLDAGQSTREDAQSTMPLRFDRNGLGGWDLLLSKGSSKSLLENFDELNEQAMEIARLEAGIPKFGADMNDRTLPPEMGADFEAKYISYAKGCYTGQEVLMRIHSRGHTNKTWVALVLEGAVNPGDIVSHSSREDAGVITSIAQSPRFGFIAGAMLRNEAAQPGEMVEVKSVKGEVHPRPLLRPV